MDKLSCRELEVVGLIAQGRSNKEIALDLAIDYKTTKFYVSNALRKLKLRTRTEIAVFVLTGFRPKLAEYRHE